MRRLRPVTGGAEALGAVAEAEAGGSEAHPLGDGAEAGGRSSTRVEFHCP